MLDQFKLIYESDPALRKLLGDEINKYSVEEKLEILRAYMEGGGVKGLIDNEDDYAGMEMDPEEEKMIHEAFDDLYSRDPKLQALLGDNVGSLGVMEKRQILIEIREKGGIDGLLEEEPENSFVIHNGKRFDRVQIEEDDNEYLMDEEGNLYDRNFKYIGQANGSDGEEA